MSGELRKQMEENAKLIQRETAKARKKAPLESPAELVPLSEKDEARLEIIENKIETGIAAFIEVAELLSEVKEDKLYRKNFKTFNDYCREKWGIGRARAYQILDAAEVNRNLSTTGIQITNERQGRILKDVNPSQQRKAMKAAVKKAKGKAPTAIEIKAEVEKLLPPTPIPAGIDEPLPDDAAILRATRIDIQSAMHRISKSGRKHLAEMLMKFAAELEAA